MSKKVKIFIVVALIVAFSAIIFGVYYRYFQFNQQDVKDYINEEVAKYPADQQPGIYKIIVDGVENILSDKELVSQCLEKSKLYGTPKEMELVHGAIMQARNYGYLSY